MLFREVRFHAAAPPPLTKTTDDIALSAAAAAERFWVVDGKAELFRK